MKKWSDKRFDKRYRIFYVLLCICAACFFVYAYFAFKRRELEHKQEVFLWSFKGVVDGLRQGDKNTVYIKVNGIEYHLTDYNFSTNDSLIKSALVLRNGDSIIKNRNDLNIKIIKAQTGKVLILPSYFDKSGDSTSK